MTRVKADCFAYKPGQQKPRRRKAECTALDKLYCRDGECRFYKAEDAVGYQKDEYIDTQNMSTAAALIRAQGEQICRMSAEEYLIDKIGGDADGQESNLRLRGCEGTGEGDGERHTE